MPGLNWEIRLAPTYHRLVFVDDVEKKASGVLGKQSFLAFY